MVLILPDNRFISPRNADKSELLPEPTLPTTPTKSPVCTFMLISESKGSLSPQEKDAVSITSGAPCKRGKKA